MFISWSKATKEWIFIPLHWFLFYNKCVTVSRSTFSRFNRFPSHFFQCFECVFVYENTATLKTCENCKLCAYNFCSVFIYLFPNFYWYVCTLNDMCIKDTRHTVLMLNDLYPILIVYSSISLCMCLYLCENFHLVDLLILFSFISIIVNFWYALTGNSFATAIRFSHGKSCENCIFNFHTWSCTNFPNIEYIRTKYRPNCSQFIYGIHAKVL